MQMTLSDLFQTRIDPAQQDAMRQAIRAQLLNHSRYIQTPNFIRCHDNDLKTLFDAYDVHFFAHQLSENLRRGNAWPMPMRFSGRLRSSGGITTRNRNRQSNHFSYAIDISHNVLFENFRTPEDTVTVVGLDCIDRLDAMMRIMEHELLHLAEFLTFGDSRCSQARFQQAAQNLFGHTSHKHSMVTRRQKLIESTPFRPGQRVRFEYDGRVLEGIVNRLTQRATVLVEDPGGVLYTSGKRYQKFYIPVKHLETV